MQDKLRAMFCSGHEQQALERSRGLGTALDLRGIVVQSWSLVGLDLTGADLTEAVLNGRYFDASLRGTDLVGARYNTEPSSFGDPPTRFPDGFEPRAAGMVVQNY